MMKIGDKDGWGRIVSKKVRRSLRCKDCGGWIRVTIAEDMSGNVLDQSRELCSSCDYKRWRHDRYLRERGW